MITVDSFINILSASFGIYIALLIFVRIVGLRSFSQMTALDFAITVAIGTTIASTVLPSKPKFTEGLALLAVLFFIQLIVSVIRRLSKSFKSVAENSPVLIMENGEILQQNLKSTNMTEEDLMAKLREANAFEIDRVLAVVFESTGDISVIHGEGKVAPKVLLGVKR